MCPIDFRSKAILAEIKKQPWGIEEQYENVYTQKVGKNHTERLHAKWEFPKKKDKVTTFMINGEGRKDKIVSIEETKNIWDFMCEF